MVLLLEVSRTGVSRVSIVVLKISRDITNRRVTRVDVNSGAEDITNARTAGADYAETAVGGAAATSEDITNGHACQWLDQRYYERVRRGRC